MSDIKTPNAANDEAYLNETIRQIETLAADQKQTMDRTSPVQDEVPFSTEAPLLINRIKKNNETGGFDINLALSLSQVYVLLNFAIMFLATQGLAQFVDAEEDPKEPSPPETITLGAQVH